MAKDKVALQTEVQ